MDKYIIAIYGFGIIQEPSTMGEKMLEGYLRSLSGKPEYQNKDYTKNVSIAQFIKLTIPSFEICKNPNEKFKLSCELDLYGITIQSPITNLKKKEIESLEEYMREQSLEKRVITVEEHAAFNDRKPCLIIAVNPTTAAKTIDDYLENVKKEMIMGMSTRGSALLS